MNKRHTYLTLLIIVLSIIAKAQTDKTIKQYLKNRNEAYISINIKNKKDISILDKIVGIDARGINKNKNKINAYITSKQYEHLLKTNYKFDVKTPPSLIKAFDMCTDINAVQNWNCYPTYEQYINLMTKFANDYPEICSLHEIGESVDGRKILTLKISDNVAIDENEPEFFYTSTMHGDEIAGLVLMNRFISYLLENYSTSDRVKQLVDSKEIWINPLANPDGTYAAGNSTITGAKRNNANSFDLNRNFPDPEYGEYPGGTRQIETQDMMDFMQAHNFLLVANFHGGAEVVNYPWDTKKERHIDDFWYQNISRQYVDTVHDNSTGYMLDENNGITNGFDWYPIHGGRQDYVNYFLNTHETTIELSENKIPDASELNNLWKYNYRSFINYIDRIDSGVYGKVENENNQYITANVFVENIDNEVSNCYSNNNSGMYYRKLSSGIYNFIFTANGYKDLKISNINVVENTQVKLNVQLETDNTKVDTILEEELQLVSFINPFRDELNFELKLNENTEIKVLLYNISGKLLLETENKLYSKGTNFINIDTQTLKNGIYICKIKTKKQNFELKLIRVCL